MTSFQDISGDLVQGLSLDYEPVGVMLYTDTDPLPDDIPFTEREVKSYCEALILAGKGEILLLKKEEMGCKPGTSVLGFEKDMKVYLEEAVSEKYKVGLFDSEEASAETLLKSTYMEEGKTRAAFIAPLSRFSQQPQVVIFTANSEQVMWLLYALNYETGGKIDLPQSGGALGGCADITALPILKGIPNITFLGLSCRLKSSIEPFNLMLGAPGDRLESIHHRILGMSRPISRLSKMR